MSFGSPKKPRPPAPVRQSNNSLKKKREFSLPLVHEPTPFHLLVVEVNQVPDLDL